MSRSLRFVGFLPLMLLAALAQQFAESAKRALTHPWGCDYNLVKHMKKPPSWAYTMGGWVRELIRRFGD